MWERSRGADRDAYSRHESGAGATRPKLAIVTEQRPRRRVSARIRRRRLVVVVVAAVAVLGLGGTAAVVALQQQSVTDAAAPAVSAGASGGPVSPGASAGPSSAPASPPVDKAKSFFDKRALSIDDPNSLWVVADKLRPLNPLDYVPPDLVGAAVPGDATMRAEAASAMEGMFAAATAEAGLRLSVQNAYRSYGTQVSVHDRLVGQLGRERARAQSAVPGYSEHQTGLSADIMASNGVCTIQACFGNTPEGIWLAENAWRFGYHLRYPDGKTPITGYVFEPWHYRYVGVALSTELHLTGVTTLEEFFGLPAAPDYAPGV